MAHPAHYFIRSLMILEADCSDAAINAKLKLYGMGTASPTELCTIRGSIELPPDDLQLWNPRHRPSVKWLRAQQVYSMTFPDAGNFEMKTEILPYPRLREKVERLILGNVAPGEASYRLKKLGVHLSEIAISEYKHYFWNPEIMGLSDWVEYLNKDDSKRMTALKDGYRSAIQGGPELALYRTGVEKELDNKKILMEVQREMYFTFQEIKSMPLSQKKVEMLAHCARNISRIDERIQAGDTAIQQVMKQFEKFKVHHDADKVKSLFDLAPTGSVSQKSRIEILAAKDGDN